jgi:TRAP-type C4-dicarboxylate transport system permease small subunit
MLRRLSGLMESLAAALLIAAVALNFANVVARYAFGRPIVTA